MINEQQWFKEMELFLSIHKNKKFSIQFPDCKIDYFISEDSLISFSDLMDFKGNHIYLRDLFIHENSRNKGLGKELIENLLIFAKEVGHKRIETEVNIFDVNYTFCSIQ